MGGTLELADFEDRALMVRTMVESLLSDEERSQMDIAVVTAHVRSLLLKLPKAIDAMAALGKEIEEWEQWATTGEFDRSSNPTDETFADSEYTVTFDYDTTDPRTQNRSFVSRTDRRRARIESPSFRSFGDSPNEKLFSDRLFSLREEIYDFRRAMPKMIEDEIFQRSSALRNSHKMLTSDFTELLGDIASRRARQAVSHAWAEIPMSDSWAPTAQRGSSKSAIPAELVTGGSFGRVVSGGLPSLGRGRR